MFVSLGLDQQFVYSL